MQLKRKPLTAAVMMALTLPATYAAEDPQPIAPVAEPTLNEVEVRAGRPQDDYAPGAATVGGKTPAPVRDIPQSVTVINRAVMDAQGVTTLTEALRGVPGITLSAGEGGVIGDNINLRGFSARTDLYLDGMRDRGQYTRDAFFLDAVEVLKGPSSMLFGRGSTGGVINQVSKKPALKARDEASVGAGTDDYYRVTADVNRPTSESSAFRITALGHTNESTRDVIETKRYGLAPSLRLGIGTPTEVALSALVQQSREIADYGVPVITNGTVDNPGKPVDVPANRFYGFTDDRFDQEVGILSARVEHRFAPALSLRNQLQYGKADLEANPTVFTGSVTPATISVARTRRERERSDAWLINQADLTSEFGMGAVRHTVTTGIELARDWFKNQRYNWSGVPNTNLQNPAYEPMPAGATRTLGDYTESTADTFAVYVNDQLHLAKEWKLVGGVRWDRFATDFLTRTAAGVETPLARTDKMTSYRLGALYQPDAAQSYYLSHGNSFNPSAEGATLAGAGGSSVNGTVSLDPEENRAYEIGAKWDMAGGDLALNAALFRVDKLNARTTDPITKLTTLDGNIRVDGVELGAAGKLTAAWQVFAGYTHLNGEIVAANEANTQGRVPQNMPTHAASLWTTYRFAKVWEVGGGAIYSSDRFVNNTNTAMIDGYRRYDATVAYKQKQYDVRLNLQNLGDEEYYDVASATRATPAKGRAAVLTLTSRF